MSVQVKFKTTVVFLIFAALIQLTSCRPTTVAPSESETIQNTASVPTDTVSDEPEFSLELLKADNGTWTIHTDIPELTVAHTEDCGDGRTLLICEGGKNDTFDHCLDALSRYETVSYTESGDNRFATLDMGAHVLNVSYLIHDGYIRFTVTEDTEPTLLYRKAAEKKDVCEPMIIFHGLAWSEEGYKTYQSGLSMLIRLSDGRFLVIDGGYSRDKDADDIYRLMKDNTPSGMKPTVAVWLVTHAHGDHSQAFASQFSKKYASKTVVESVIFNKPSFTMFASEAVRGNYNAIYTAASKYSASVIRPHTGDRYYVGDAVIDVLFTSELLCPKPFTNFNTSSTVFSVTVKEQRILITGDATNEVFSVLVGTFGSALKADIVQVAHHGETTGVADTESISVMQGYRYMSPSLVLWPSGEETYKKEKNRSYNLTLTLLPSVKEIIVAGDTDHIIALPYKAD